jgi:hypothetical protein
MTGRKYTWANSLSSQTFENLDRILITTEWEEKIPLSTVRALTRKISDHTPLLLNIGDPSNVHSQLMFKFELGWLLRDGFMDMIRELWSTTSHGQTPMEIWQRKIHRTRQYLRG